MTSSTTNRLGDLRAQRSHRSGDQRLRVAALRVAIRVRRRDVVLCRKRQVEAAVEDRQCGQSRAGRRRAVVAALERDEVLLRGPAERVPVLHDEAHRGVHGFRAAEREVGTRERGRSDLRELGGKADRRLAGEAEVAGGVGQGAQLRGRGLHDAFLAVADVHAPQAGEGIEQLVAAHVGEPRAAGGREHQRAALFVLAPGGDGVDKVRAVERGKGIRGEAGGAHGGCDSTVRSAAKLRTEPARRGAALRGSRRA